MKDKIAFLTITVVFTLGAHAAFAQSGTSTTQNGPIQQRKENQQKRIANGIQSGKLTAGETKRLESREAGINKEEKSMRASDNGKLSKTDRSEINKQQNGMSKRIYDDKHNGANAKYGDNKVGERRERQQQRIAQGIKSGQLKAGQTAHLEGREQAINREVKGERAANGGKLTKGERATVNRQQNRASQKIREAKHK